MSRHPSWVVFGILGLVVELAEASPLGTAFLYQGQLTRNGGALSATADFEFTLWDAADGGNTIGDVVALNGVDVVDGLFAIELDFGVNAFDGDARWLEIAVRSPAGSGSYTTLSPRQRLAATPYAVFSMLPWRTNTNGLFTEGTFVGIGHDDPSFPLDVRTTAGRALFSWTTSSTGQNYGAYCQTASDQGVGVFGYATADTGLTAGVLGYASSATGKGVYGFALDSHGANYGVYGETNSDNGHAGYFRGRGYFSDDLGVTAVNPASKLHVIRSESDPRATVTFQTITNAQADVSQLIRFERTSIDGYQSFGQTSPAGIRLNSISSGNVLLGLGGGNVGVNDEAPDGKLHVTSSANASVGGAGGILVIENAPSGNQLAFDGNDILARNGGTPNTLRLNTGSGDVALAAGGGGSVGVGLAAPLRKLHVLDDGLGLVDAQLSSDVVVVEDNDAILGLYSNAGGDWGSGIVFGEVNEGTGQLVNKWSISRRTTGSGGGLQFKFGADPAHAANPATLILRTDGTVSCPMVEIRGADVAERFPTSEPHRIEPGTVMEIDPDHAGKLRIARGAYNPRVAGVVSGAGDLPIGAVLGNLPGQEDDPPIALSGRVWVRCDARESAIQPGDLLTTSDQPGAAMKAIDIPRSHGSTIGKAMSGLARGESGLVLVLVNLQ